MTSNSLAYIFLGTLGLISIAGLVAAAYSPLLAWRDPIYVLSSFAGIIALILLMFQPLLAVGWLPSVSKINQQRFHRALGGAVLLSVIFHVGGLWITSPPDVIDALTFASPTLFTPFGVVALWAVVLTAALFAFRSKLKISPRSWKRIHLLLAWVIVIGTVVHALLIEGAMETATKTALCFAAIIVLAKISWNKLVH